MDVLELFAAPAVLALFAVLAARFGFDSPDGSDDPPQPWLGSAR